MKEVIAILSLALLLLGCTYAADSSVDINGVEFELPSKYQGGELYNGRYELEDVFSIRCVDDDIVSAIGLWAEENDFSQDLKLAQHPVRHFSQYNKYVGDNHSHAYFACGKSVYEISWIGEEITPEIEKLINDTPKSEIDSDDFYNALDKSYEIYKAEKIDKLNRDSQYNYLEAKYHSNDNDSHDDTRFKEILYTYCLK